MCSDLTDGDVEKPGHTFPLFLLFPCVQQHWPDENFEFLYQINFPLAEKTDYIKIIRLLMENLVTNEVGVLIPMPNKSREWYPIKLYTYFILASYLGKK